MLIALPSGEFGSTSFSSICSSIQITATVFWLVPLLSAPTSPSPDDGKDYTLLRMPQRLVAGDDLKVFVRCRPAKPYALFIDTSINRHTVRGAPVHLSGVATTLVVHGTMPANGEAIHTFATPALTGVEGVQLFYQAFNLDNSIGGGIGASTYKTLTLHDDDDQPLIRLLTVNKIPLEFNGSEPNEGTLLAPPTGFTVDVRFDARNEGPIDTSSFVITADVPLANGTIPAGTNLAQFFTVGQDSASGVVDSS